MAEIYRLACGVALLLLRVMRSVFTALDFLFSVMGLGVGCVVRLVIHSRIRSRALGEKVGCCSPFTSGQSCGFG